MISPPRAISMDSVLVQNRCLPWHVTRYKASDQLRLYQNKVWWEKKAPGLGGTGSCSIANCGVGRLGLRSVTLQGVV